MPRADMRLDLPLYHRYHMQFTDTFTADDAVTWITQERGYLGQVVEFDLPAGDALSLLQELLDYGFIRRVSKWETPSSVGWETTEHVSRWVPSHVS